MTTFLFSILTAGSDRMAQTDPHGWTLTIISVTVVFLALIVLYFLYNLSGKIFTGAFKRKSSTKKKAQIPDAEVAAAIALALDMEEDGDTYAAIAAAIHLYLATGVHDTEPGIVTITRKDSSPWSSKALTFRKLPR